MTGLTAMAPLPRSLDPLPGESLPGFVLRLAHRLDRTPARIMELVGLPEHASSGMRMGPVTHLHPSTARTFATATRLKLHEVEGMCLSSLTSRYSPLEPAYLGRRRNPARLASAEPWVFGRWSRYCPQCLAGDGSAIQNRHGGAWQRTWRLPPVFACTIHRRLLADRCPLCREPALHLPASRGRLLPCAKAEGLHPTQCRNQVGHSRPLAAWIRIACGHRLDQTDDPDPNDALTASPGLVVDALMALQQRILGLLDPTGPGHTNTFGAPTPVSRYFTDLRLLANLICATWPIARPSAISPVFADHLDTHVTERRGLIANMAQRDGKIARHTIYDRPPAASASCASLIAIADGILAGHHQDLLAELIDGPDGQRWAEHFIRAERYCSPGLATAAAPHVARYRKRPANGRLPGDHEVKRRTTTHRERRAQTPQRAARSPQPVEPLPLRPGLHRYGAQHVPAFLTEDWHDRHLVNLHGIDPRFLRRGAAIALIQLTKPCRVTDAADFLDLPTESARYAYRAIASWTRRSHHGAAFLDAVHALADELDAAADAGQLIDYNRRRTALADWLIPDPDWQHIAAQLRRRDRADYGERKRNTASALIWTKITQGEHLFAPHRQSPPGYRPGSTQDRGLSIDRAWWRARTDQPGRHYSDLDHICADLAQRVAQQIDHGIPPTADRHPHPPAPI